MTLEFPYKDNPNNDLSSFELPEGTWLFRIWGAQGGYIRDRQSSRGAYSEGIYITNKKTKLYYFVGQKGLCSLENITTKAKFSGGNNLIGKNKNLSCTGGEATFISKDSTAMSILLISGSGGGSGSYFNIEYNGGFGGPFASDAIGSAFNMSDNDAKKVRGKGATFSRPGEGGSYVGNKKYLPCVSQPGEYLKGGNSNTSALGSSGGGGAGYYGGGGGADLAGGGGGSSFASYELYNVILLGGDKIFLSPNNQTETGHEGNGHIRIEPANPYTIDKIKNQCTKNCDSSPYLSARIFFILSSDFVLGIL